MLVLHSSDTHGDFPTAYYRFVPSSFDVWVDSGDFFPNLERPIVPEAQKEFQESWLHTKMEAFARWLGTRPLLYTPGNHDFADLGTIAREYGIQAHNLCEGPFEFGGETFAGFREIPFIFGEWAGEVHSFEEVLNRVFNWDPTVLVSHSPPGGILDGIFPIRYGCSELTTRLTYHPHRIKTHLFGHIHVNGGEETEEMGIRFYNGATQVRIIEV